MRTDRVPSGLHIRHGRAGDNNLLAVLGAACFREAFAAGNCPDDLNAYIAAAFRPERQAAELADPHSVFLIACAGKEAVGYAHLRNGPPPVPLHARSPLEIARFYARAGWIGKGVGPALMEACLSEAALKGHDVLWLGVWEHNPRAIGFYGKWGFEQIGKKTFRLGEDLQTDLVLYRPVCAAAASE